jgi:hypothetical protein
MSSPEEHFEIDEIDNLVDNTEMVSLFLKKRFLTSGNG